MFDPVVLVSSLVAGAIVGTGYVLIPWLQDRVARRRPLRVGQLPPDGTPCGLCADACPDCGVKYMSASAGWPKHEPSCQLSARIVTCPNPAVTVVRNDGSLLPLCASHAAEDTSI